MDTTFNQYIGDTSFSIQVPMTRVETLISKVDTLNETGNFKKAFSMIEPFLASQLKPAAAKASIEVAPMKDKKSRVVAIIASMSGADRGKLIKAIQDDMGISYANARHYVVNVAGI